MGYETLAPRLVDGLDARGVVTLPDGSVDHYYTVADATGTRVPTQDELVDLLARGNVRSLELREQRTDPGGQAVNAALQVDALGQSVRLYGHLDDGELGPFPFPTVSMGAPATVHVLSFAREDLMLSVESPDIREWTVEELFDAAAVNPDDWVDDEVIVLQNWVGFPAMTDAIRVLAGVDLGSGPLVFDPGDVTDAPTDALRSLCRELESLAGTVETVVSANDRELARLADALGVDAGGTEREARLRERLGVAAVVRHHADHAVAATDDGLTEVENFDAARIARRTGAGDRFDGALAVGLAADLPWAEALGLGNAAATHFVETGETATETDLVQLLAQRRLRD